MINALSQTLLKIVSPGVPDFYQGSELWDFRLVDRDNRRPVNFAKRHAALDDIQMRTNREWLSPRHDLSSNCRDARIKLYLIWKALNFRKEHPDLFAKGDFLSIAVECSRRENVAAFARRYRTEWALAIVPGCLARAKNLPNSPFTDQFWDDTRICLASFAPATWFNVFTGEETTTHQDKDKRIMIIDELLSHFPVALLAPTKALTSIPSVNR
jgi:(1->4)-alpha-D-glucan 1-alpha-D-glucosylmutase